MYAKNRESIKIQREVNKKKFDTLGINSNRVNPSLPVWAKNYQSVETPTITPQRISDIPDPDID